MDTTRHNTFWTHTEHRAHTHAHARSRWMASSICLQFYEVFKVGVNGKPGLEELAKSQKWLESGILNTSGKKRVDPDMGGCNVADGGAGDDCRRGG